MNPQWWSWALTAVGVFGLWLAGRRSPWGWAVGIGAQLLWFAYSISTQQWGFLVSCFAYGGIHSVNLIRSIRERGRSSGAEHSQLSDTVCTDEHRS